MSVVLGEGRVLPAAEQEAHLTPAGMEMSDYSTAAE